MNTFAPFLCLPFSRTQQCINGSAPFLTIQIYNVLSIDALHYFNSSKCKTLFIFKKITDDKFVIFFLLLCENNNNKKKKMTVHENRPMKIQILFLRKIR